MNAGTNTVTLATGTLNLSATGAGTYQGGTMSVIGGTITDTHTFSWLANSTGTNLVGGSISLIASNNLSFTGASETIKR